MIIFIKEKYMKINQTIKIFVDIIKLVIVSLVVVLPIRYFLFQPFYVSGASMEPSFFDNEYLIVDEISYRFNLPERGDIVVFKNPQNENETFIKRIIGLPGERIEVKNSQIEIFNDEYPDGTILNEPYIDNKANVAFLNTIVNLKQDEYFVMGDNRPFSMDSRIFGPIKFDTIIGKVVFRGWPFDRVDVFGRTDYEL